MLFLGDIMKNKKILSLLLVSLLFVTGCSLDDVKKEDNKDISIELLDIDGNKTNYTFIYNDEEYVTWFKEDTWHIVDSYKITNEDAMIKICEALMNEHKIPSKDRKSYREIDDLVYEWKQHNIIYEMLPNSSKWKSHAKDVDLDPDDQGKSFKELYYSRNK